MMSRKANSLSLQKVLTFRDIFCLVSNIIA